MPTSRYKSRTAELKLQGSGPKSFSARLKGNGAKRCLAASITVRSKTMLWRLKLRAGQHRPFWRLLRLVRRFRFLFRRQQYLASERFLSAKSAAQILLSLARVTFVPLAFALVTATILLLSEVFFPRREGFGFLPVPLWHIDERDSYSSFLSTISGIGGVLIALYYTGMVAVGSAVYARAPSVLRNLLLREPIGKLYIELVAFTTFLSLCLLAFFAIGFSPIRLAFPLLILLAGITILSFVQLGQQAFHFFDPTRLSGSLFEDMERSVRRATVAGGFWDDPSFQSHASQQANAALKALGTLADFSMANKHLRSDAIAEVAVNTIAFLYRYEAARKMIPTESKWYPTQHSHPDFYLADAMKVDMAIRTGGSVQPETVARENWVEEAALSVVMRALESNLREKNETGTFRILESLRMYTERLGASWEVTAALALAAKIADAVLPLALLGHEAPAQTSRWELGLVEYLGLFPTSALLGFTRSLRESSLEHLRQALANVRWGSRETLYRAGIFRFALSDLEWFEPRLKFEAWVEGRKTTPDWFVLQVVARDYLKALHFSMDSLLNASEELFGAWLLKCAAANELWAGAVILNRQGEYISKFSVNLPTSLQVAADYETAKVLKDLRGWPSASKDSINEALSTAERKHRVALAKAALGLTKSKRPSQLPDYAGEFLARTARALVDALFDDKWDFFEEAFPYFWESSIKKTLSLIAAESAVGEDQFLKFALSTAPLVDLMEISGFAILASEMGQSPEPWNCAQQIWDQYLADRSAGAARIDILSRALLACDIPLMIPPGEIARTGWRTHASDWVARRLGLNPNAAWGFFGGSRGQRVAHPSVLVRVLARDTFSGMYRGMDIFGAMFFKNFPGANLGETRFRFNNLVHSIAMESRRDTRESLDREGDFDGPEQI